MTDFGTANDAVAICRAVIAGIVPDVRIMDITHQVTPFSIEEGARFLAGVTAVLPGGNGVSGNQGNFSSVYKITPPVSVLIARKKPVSAARWDGVKVRIERLNAEDAEKEQSR